MCLKKKKYKINDLLEALPLKQNRRALKILPAELGISIATFYNYRAIEVDDTQDIPHTIVVKLEQFFGIKPGELQNFTTNVKPINEPGNHLSGKANQLKKPSNKPHKL